MTNITTIYKKPNPIEIEIEMTDEDLDDILNEIKLAPVDEFMEMHFVLISENKCITVTAEVSPHVRTD